MTTRQKVSSVSQREPGLRGREGEKLDPAAYRSPSQRVREELHLSQARLVRFLGRACSMYSLSSCGEHIPSRSSISISTESSIFQNMESVAGAQLWMAGL